MDKYINDKYFEKRGSLYTIYNDADFNIKFVQDKISMEKIIFLKSVQIVIKNGMNIIGVDTPEKM